MQMTTPNFLVIGAQKCGTTALCHALCRHREVYMSPIKEPFYFVLDGAPPSYPVPDARYMKRLRYTDEGYRQLFQDVDGQSAIGEASALYLSSYHPERTAARIHAFNPQMRLIALLRQPAERAWSAFHYYRSHGYEPLRCFDEALAVEEERRRAGWCPDLWHRSNGRYFANLKPYFDRFPREQIRVYLYEDLSQRPHEVLQDVFEFLGVDRAAKIALQRMNETRTYRSYRLHRFLSTPNPVRRILQNLLSGCVFASLNRWVIERNQLPKPVLDVERWRTLTESYRSDIEQLQVLIGRDLSHWFERTGASS
jgi:hypothetical protein